MQPSAPPALAHTRTRPVHWLATAAALAAIVAGSALVQPPDAVATQAGPPAAPAPAPDPAAVHFPLDCGVAKPEVVKKGSGDLDGDGSPETVAVVRCASGSGTPPSGVYVLARPTAKGAKPRIVATLVDPAQRLSVSDFAVRGGAVTATLLGYSSADVPRCCPDRQEDVKWRWQNGKFVRSEHQPTESTAQRV